MLNTVQKVYVAQALSCWGDNIWLFAGGLYMIAIEPESLRLTAIYGLVRAGGVIALAPIVGNWIDVTSRMTAARTCLLIQNFSVTLCAVILSLFLLSRYADKSGIEDEFGYGVRLVVIAAIIVLAAAAQLASVGSAIVIQRDWIVVVAGDDHDLLAKMNAVLRTIELVTFMLAPVLTGPLFSLLGYIYTGLLLASWNVLSMFLELALLQIIYNTCPALAAKKSNGSKGPDPCREQHQQLKSSDTDEDEGVGYAVSVVTEETESHDSSCFRMTTSGWVEYMTHPIRNAGLGLALLYMTVLGFDNITYGFVLTQRISESVLGVITGISALVGILGSLAFPLLRKAVGLERSGLVGMVLLVTCTSLGLVSVVLPGSPFEMRHIFDNADNDTSINNATSIDNDIYLDNINIYNTSNSEEELNDRTSVITLITGITLARFGLWIADLSVTQIIQERVSETKRGIINGVQNSLNNGLDLLKCVLVILFPLPAQFGYLIALSFVFISLGLLSYSLYACKQPSIIAPCCEGTEQRSPKRAKTTKQEV